MRRYGNVVCVIFVLLAVFKAVPAESDATFENIFALGLSQEVIRMASGICPQNRKTRSAPKRYLKKANPLLDSPVNIAQGERLYFKDARPTTCALCHGLKGNGNGRLARGLNPPPRNFTCVELMDTIPDGQLFWIIKNGSKGTGMPIHKETLSDKKIWQLIRFIRKFAN